MKNINNFEDYVCNLHGLSRHMKRPRLHWTGEGKSNIDKLCSLNKCPNKFKPILSESKFVKCDARDEQGNLYEIKKYTLNQLKKYRLYSEPIIKVSPSRSKWGEGHPYYDNFNDCVEYNDFIDNLIKTNWWNKYNAIILDSITHSNRGIYCKDGFIPHTQLEFKWVINKGEYGTIFDGYNRLCIVFKLKEQNNSNIDFVNPSKSILEYVKEFFNI